METRLSHGTALVTGGTGLVGSALTAPLVQPGVNVRSADDSSAGSPSRPPTVGDEHHRAADTARDSLETPCCER